MLHHITREISIDAAHRVPDHESKCCNVHGHRYTIQATCVGALQEEGSQAGMVLDFGFLKDEMMSVIDEPFDHAMIVWSDDPLLSQFRECCGKLQIIPSIPTAENLARLWFNQLAPEVERRSKGLASLARLRVYETVNCWSDYPASG